MGSNPVVSLSSQGNAGAAVLRQAQDEGGVRGEVVVALTTNFLTSRRPGSQAQTLPASALS
jgi:hypothetical protein